MQEQLGREPNPKKCPPGPDDFPEVVNIAITIFNLLGNRIYPEVGYTGKDYTALPVFLDMYDVTDRDLVIDILIKLDSHAIDKSQKEIKRQHDKMKRKNSG